MARIKYVLNQLPADGKTLGFIPIDSDYIKFELKTTMPNPFDSKFQPIFGSRIWINSKAPIALKKQEVKFKPKKSFLLPIVKLPKSGERPIDFYEIHPSGYGIIEQLLNEKEDEIKNSKWHIKFEIIKEKKKYHDFTIARYQEKETPQKQGELPFFPPHESILLQIADFSDLTPKIDLKLKEKIDSSKIDLIVDRIVDKTALSQKQTMDVLISFSLKNLLNKKSPKKNGALLFGPPGTGKTRTMNVFFDLYKEELSIPTVKIDANDLLNDAVVGGFASKIADMVFKPALNNVLNTHMPCLIYIDEATALVTKPRESNVSDWYEEGLDTIKRFLNKESYPGLIMCVATNAEFGNLDKTIANRRLKAIKFDFLDKTQFISLWENKFEENMPYVNFSRRNVVKLAEICADVVNGAFVHDFTEDYEDFALTRELESDEDFDMTDKDSRKEFLKKALGEGNSNGDSILANITFDMFYLDFLKALYDNLLDIVNEKFTNLKKGHYMSYEELSQKKKEVKKIFGAKLYQVRSEIRSLTEDENWGADKLEEEFDADLDALDGDSRLDQLIKSAESNSLIVNILSSHSQQMLVLSEFEERLSFKKVLAYFYMSEKAVILSESVSDSRKISKYKILLSIMKNISNVFNSGRFPMLHEISSSENLALFLKDLYSHALVDLKEQSFSEFFASAVGSISNENSKIFKEGEVNHDSANQMFSGITQMSDDSAFVTEFLDPNSSVLEDMDLEGFLDFTELLLKFYRGVKLKIDVEIAPTQKSVYFQHLVLFVKGALSFANVDSKSFLNVITTPEDLFDFFKKSFEFYVENFQMPILDVFKVSFNQFKQAKLNPAEVKSVTKNIEDTIKSIAGAVQNNNYSLLVERLRILENCIRDWDRLLGFHYGDDYYDGENGFFNLISGIIRGLLMGDISKQTLNLLQKLIEELSNRINSSL